MHEGEGFRPNWLNFLHFSRPQMHIQISPILEAVSLGWQNICCISCFFSHYRLEKFKLGQQIILSKTISFLQR